MSSFEPLSVLLAKTWTALTIEVDNTFEAASASEFGRLFRVSLAMWANGLRLIEEQGTPLQDVRLSARAECNIGGLERWGWVKVDNGERTGRRPGFGSSRGLREATLLRPTRAGTVARRLWPAILDDVESQWRDRFGAAAVGALRRALPALGKDMPWAPPQVSAADGFHCHLSRASGLGRTGAPSDTTERPLVVLLGQALTALTVRAEERSSVSLALGENLLATLAEEPLLAKELPARTGLAKEAVTVAVNFAVRRQLAETGPGRLVSLTEGGAAALASHRSAMAEMEDANDLRADLQAVLSQREALAEGLQPPPGCWRGQPPYLAQTRRLLADPTANLPRHPMVLHRGGWPDGS